MGPPRPRWAGVPVWLLVPTEGLYYVIIEAEVDLDVGGGIDR